MGFTKRTAMFLCGGLAYVGLELLWRGYSHGSMFLAGGSSFMLLGRLEKMTHSLPLRAVGGAGVITAVELAAGEIFNRGYTVWDYRSMPLNYKGQICLPYCLLWIPVGLAGMMLYKYLEVLFFNKKFIKKEE